MSSLTKDSSLNAATHTRTEFQRQNNLFKLGINTKYPFNFPSWRHRSRLCQMCDMERQFEKWRSIPFLLKGPFSPLSLLPNCVHCPPPSAGDNYVIRRRSGGCRSTHTAVWAKISLVSIIRWQQRIITFISLGRKGPFFRQAAL